MKRIKKIAALVMMLMLAAGVTVFTAGCGEEIPMMEIQKAYSNKLTEDEKYIKDYDWQLDFSGDIYSTMNRPVALCDVSGDGIPELFVMEAMNDMSAKLYMFTYDVENSRIKELKYTLPATGEKGYHDVLAGGPHTYCVFKTTNPNEFAIYWDEVDYATNYYMCTYSMEGIKTPKATKSMYYTWIDGYEAYYTIDEDEVKEDEFMEQWNAACDSLDPENVIIFSGNRAEDVSIFKKFKPEDALCMSYDDMQKYLAEDHSEEE